MRTADTMPSRRFSRADPALLVSPREARNAALEIRDEVKRLRAQHRATIAALQQRRRELIAEHKTTRAERAALVRKAIADLRAAAKQARADRAAEFRARLKDINDEIRAERAELRGLTPLAREELRAIMLRGESLKSAKAKLAGQAGARARNESVSERLNSILDEIGIDRFRDGSKEIRAFVKRWLSKRPAKNATSLQQMAGYDPRRRASAVEQWREWAAENAEELQALELEWTEAAVQRELDREQEFLSKAHGYLEQVAHETQKTLQAAAQCADPWTYQDLEQLRAEIPTVDLRNESAVSDIAGKVHDAIAIISTECAPRARRAKSKRKTARDRKVKRTVSVRRKSARRAPARSASAPRILAQLKALAGSDGQTRLATLRANTRGPWAPIADTVRALSADGKIHLYREDNNAALTQADRDAVVLVGGEPRHIAVVAQPRAARRTASAQPSDAEQLLQAFDGLVDSRNMVLLFDLRAATGFPRARFDAALHELRKARVLFLESSQGQAVRLNDEQRAAGIDEEGRRMVYASRRDAPPPRPAGRADFEERKERRVNRLSERAEKKSAAAKAKRQQANSIGQRFELGQPIILGHHSTKRALRDREKMDSATRASIKEQEAAQVLARRAAAAQANTAISSDDPRASEKLAARIDAAEAELELVNLVRKIIKRTKTPEARAVELAALGLPASHDLIRFAMTDPIGGGFPSKLNSFIATNMQANLRRMRQRLKDLGQLATVPELKPERIGAATIREEDNRIKLEFDGKPEARALAELKGHGFRWSRTEGAWLAKLTPQNRNTVIAKARTIAAFTQGPSRGSTSAPAMTLIKGNQQITLTADGPNATLTTDNGSETVSMKEANKRFTKLLQSGWQRAPL
jgi:hypothetical protein